MKEATVYPLPHTVTCPTCQQGPGHPCVRLATGEPMEYWHPARERVL